MAVAVATRPRSASEIAAHILEKHWDGQLPVRPQLIAQRLGVAVVGVGSPGDSEDYCGFFRTINGTPTIEFSLFDPPVRRRFTIAHELGHYALGHEGMPRDYPDSFGSKNSDPRERQANQFAAELLMPASVVRARAGRKTIDELAREFGVSKVAMGYRLSNLSPEWQ